MSPEENKARVRQAFDEFINRKNLTVVDDYVAPNYVGYYSAVPEPVRGRDEFRQFLQLYHQAFPDLRVTIDDAFAEGDKVAVRLTLRGTHQGELMGLPPTGKAVTVSAINLFQIENGQAVEQRASTDDLGMMQQLGVIPALA